MKSGGRKTFLTCEKPLLTAMVQAQTPQECKDIILNSIWDGAEAFGIQLENLKKEYIQKIAEKFEDRMEELLRDREEI